MNGGRLSEAVSIFLLSRKRIAADAEGAEPCQNLESHEVRQPKNCERGNNTKRTRGCRIEQWLTQGRRKKRDDSRDMAEALLKLCSSAHVVSPVMWGGVFEGWKGLLACYGC